MGEIRAYNEEVLFVEVWLQHFCDLLQNVQALRSYHDWNDGRDLTENHLQERQLNFQAMLPVVRVTPADKGSFPVPYEVLSRRHVDRDLAEWSPGILIKGIYARTSEPNPVAWAEQEDPLVTVPGRNTAEGGSRDLSAEDVPGMGYDYSLGGMAALSRVQPCSEHGAYSRSGRRIERPGDCGFPDTGIIRIT